eukprot:tig00001221_g7592.t1
MFVAQAPVVARGEAAAELVRSMAARRQQPPARRQRQLARSTFLGDATAAAGPSCAGSATTRQGIAYDRSGREAPAFSGPQASLIEELHRKLTSKEVSAVELAQQYLKRIEAVEPKVKSFISVSPDLALEQAKAVDARIAKGEEVGLLAGLPLAVKDNLCTRGAPTTAGSRILDGFLSPYESTASQRLLDAGMVMVGKTNMDEFGMGSSTENSGYHVTANPWDTSKVPGGSSGGSAAAVAAQECVGALGSDTGGSIRQPSAFCGVVGLKPTYGRVSRHGLIAYASSLDTVGPIARTVKDAAILLSALAGRDAMDGTSSPAKVGDYAGALGAEGGSLKGLRVGLLQETLADGLDPEVKAAVLAAAEQLRALGADVLDVSCPASPTAPVPAPAPPRPAPALPPGSGADGGASANLARYDGVRYGRRAAASDLVAMYRDSREAGLGPEVKRRIMVGTYALSSGYYDAFYDKAQRVRSLVKQDFDAAFEKVDVLVSPVAPSPAFGIGEKSSDPVSLYLGDLMTIPINLAGLPALSLPCGFTEAGLPVGMQIIGGMFGEETVLRVGHAFERSTEWHARDLPAL